MQTLFNCSGRMSPKLRRLCAELMSQEFYAGRLEVEPDADAISGFSFAKALPYPTSITHLTSRATLGYQRNWEHIRHDKVGLRVIWIIRRGSLRIERARGSCTIQAGEGGVLDSSAPFHARLLADGSGYSESYQIIVPHDMFITHLEGVDGTNAPFSMNSGEGRVVESLLTLLVAEGDHIRRDLARALTVSLLDAVADCMRTRAEVPLRRGLSGQRLAEIENYVMLHIADSDLCYKKVAERCRISPRYLGYLLKHHDMTFSELLWKNRLPKARDCLVAPTSRDHSVKDIAFMSGFKSAAHFSRMFKAAYGAPPLEYRRAHLNGGERSDALAA